MGAVLKVNRPDSVVTVCLHWYMINWDQGRLLAGGPVFGSSDLSYFQLDLRYWEIFPAADGNFECTPRKEKNVLFVIKDGDQVISHEAIGYEKFVKEENNACVVFLKDGGSELVLSSDYDVHFQTIQDYTRGRNVTAIIAVRKAS